jgi:O-antigen ligase
MPADSAKRIGMAPLTRQVDKQESGFFLLSASSFRLGLALVTFEQVRPFFGIQVSDYCFFFAIVMLLFQPRTFFGPFGQTKLLMGGWLILLGAVISLVNASSLSDAAAPLARCIVLFALFAPLAIIHSTDVRRNMLLILGGIFVNCIITIVQATIFPDIANVLSINPARPDISDVGRFQGLTSHPNIIGVSAALAILIGIGFLIFKEDEHLRPRLLMVIIVCTIAGLLSGSRAVFVALVPGLVVLSLSQKQRRRAIVQMLLAMSVTWGAAAYLAPAVITQFGERLDTSGSDLYSDYGRLWSAVYTVIEISQKPLLGWGIDHFNEAGLTEVPWTGEIVGVHNVFLKYWHGVGLLGAVGFLALFVAPARLILKMLKRTFSPGTTHMLRLGLGTLVLLFVVSNLGPFDYNRFLYIPLFIFGGFASRLAGTTTQLPRTNRPHASAIGDA